MATTNRLSTTARSCALATVTLLMSWHAWPALAAEPDHSETKTSLGELRANHAAIGAGVVIRDGEDIWSYSTGSRALGQDLPVGAEHKFRAGSLTKTFTATVVLQLVAEGKVELDEPVETYLPGVVQGNGYDGTKITVRQLLNHTSGIADYVPTSFLPWVHLSQYTLADLAEWGLANPPTHAPGTANAYSGTNYVLLGMIIEKVTGNTYADEYTSRIVEPLGLENTFVPAGTKALPPGHIRGYIGRVFYIDFTQVIEPSVGGSSGGIVTSGADATKFFQALVSGELVSADLMDDLLTQNGKPGPIANYALGISRVPIPCGDGEAWAHNGIWPGYQSMVAATADGRAASVVINVLNDDLFGSSSGKPSSPLFGTVSTALCDQS